MTEIQTTIPGTKTLLLGPTGTGKTHCLRTLIAAGIKPFILATEPNVQATIGDLPKGSYHLRYIKPANVSWADMKDLARKINTMSFKSLSSIEDAHKSKYNQWFEVLDTLSNYRCEIDGKEYGEVDSWSTDRCLWLDSLSGLSIMALALTVGAKSTIAPGEWGIAMSNLEWLVNNLCFNTNCHLVLTAHMEREKDEVSGGIKNMVSTLGSKLAPKIPRYFDSVIETRRGQGNKYTWEVDNPMADLKSRYLPVASGLEPTFVPLIADWKRKGGVIIPTTAGEPTTTKP